MAGDDNETNFLMVSNNAAGASTKLWHKRPWLWRCLVGVSVISACLLIGGLVIHFTNKGTEEKSSKLASEVDEIANIVATMNKEEKSKHYNLVLNKLNAKSKDKDPRQTLKDVHAANILTLTDYGSCNMSSGGGGDSPFIPDVPPGPGNMAPSPFSFGGDSGPKEKFFNDLDYALFGYDILKGFPLSTGRDPGFTLPIFKVDYKEGLKSADCRYSIPKGLVIVPMTSCVTSFSSRLITNKHEFTDILSVGLGFNAKAPTFGFNFNIGFQNMLQTIENKTHVFIMSTANCDYYFSKLVPLEIPDFSEGFLLWIDKLQESPTEETYMKFFDTYGTHAITETIFGAKYMYQYTMDTHEFERKKQHNFSLELGASVTSSLMSFGFGFSISHSQTDIARKFLNNTDVKSIVVGATPKGNPRTWAEEVKKDPVPTYYKLISMEELFTTDYMSGLNANFTEIHKNLVKYKYRYQAYLKGKCRGFQQSFFPVSNTKILNPQYTEKETHAKCMDDCLIDDLCIGVTKSGDECSIHYGEGTDKHLTANYAKGSKTYLMLRNVNETIQIKFTKVMGTVYRRTVGTTASECINMCFVLHRCSAVSFHNKQNVCYLYQSWAISNFVHDEDMTTYYAIKCSRFGA